MGGRGLDLIAVAVIATVVMLLAPQTKAARPEAVDAAISDILSDSSYQTELPGDADIGKEETESDPFEFDLKLPAFFSDIFTALLWAAGGALILLLLYFVLQEMGALNFRRKPKQKSQVNVSVYGGGEPGPEHIPELDDAERLAKQGDFSGAVHILLLRAIDHLKRTVGGNLQTSLTSREITRLEALNGAVATSLLELVSPVERSYFGGQTLVHDDYEAARRSYDALISGQSPA